MRFQHSAAPPGRHRELPSETARAPEGPPRAHAHGLGCGNHDPVADQAGMRRERSAAALYACVVTSPNFMRSAPRQLWERSEQLIFVALEARAPQQTPREAVKHG